MQTSLLSIIFILLLSSASFAQERYLLKEADMPGYVLKRQSILWADDYHNLGIEQQWKVNDKEQYLYLKYYEYKDEFMAIKEISDLSGSFAGAYIFGFPNGEIKGNSSWTYIERNAAFLQKWNVGVQIYSVDHTAVAQKIILNVSDKLLTKIGDSISTEFLIKDTELKKYQIPIARYNQMTDASKDTLVKNGFSEYKVEDTKWIFNMDSLVMGTRKQWSSSNSFFSIDVAEFSSAADVQTATEQNGNIKWSPFFLLDDKESVEKAIAEWYFHWPSNDTMKYISVIGRRGNYAIHFYYFNEKGVDVEFFKRVVLAINSEGTGIAEIENKGFKVYPNPANGMVTLEISDRSVTNCELFNSNGQLIKTLPVEQGVNNYTIRDLKEGLYLIKIISKEGTMVKKIIKN